MEANISNDKLFPVLRKSNDRIDSKELEESDSMSTLEGRRTMAYYEHSSLPTSFVNFRTVTAYSDNL